MNTTTLTTEKNVTSVQEAINLGFKYVIAYRDHYRGNSKGEIYVCNEKNARIQLSHFNMDDRGIHTMLATNDDVLAIQSKRNRLINVISHIEHSMSIYSKLYGGTRSLYVGRKMVFGTWRSIYKSVKCEGAVNYNGTTFMSRHKCMLSLVNEMLYSTPYISTTMTIVE